MELQKNRHSVYKLTYHIVLVTKYRHKCINEELFNVMQEESNRIFESWNGSVIEMSHDGDHVHLLVDLPPQIAPSKAVCSIKTVLSRKLRKDFEDYLKQFYWGTSFWSESYLVLSTGGATIDLIKQYIEDQRKESTK